MSADVEPRGKPSARTWYHTIDLPDGGRINGWFDTRQAPPHVPWPAGLRGGRALDVGTFDGFWAFELERRGAAEVVALDIDDISALDWHYDEQIRGPEAVREWGSERGPGFLEAAELMGSSARRVACSVYDLDEEVAGRFDVVFCGALLEHLERPLAALERMRSVCAGELVVCEGLEPSLELSSPRVAAARFGWDWDQWWTPNSAGLFRMVDLAGFDIVEVGKRFLVPFGPAAPRQPRRAALLHAMAARQPTKRGLLFRALRAVPRDRRPRR